MTTSKSALDAAVEVLEILSRPLPLSQLSITESKALARAALESASENSLALFNAIQSQQDEPTSPRDVESSDDFDEVIEEVLVALRQEAEVIISEEFERIIARLREPYGRFPESEIVEARRHKELFIPHLLASCRQDLDDYKSGDDMNKDIMAEDNHLLFMSFPLFSEWNVAESVPLVLELLSLPGEGVDDLLGELAHDMTPRYLAQFFWNDLERIDSFICNPFTNVYVRWSAASSYLYLVRDQRISLEHAVAALDRLFAATKIEIDNPAGLGQPYELPTGILETIMRMGALSLSTILADKNNWKYIDESIIQIKQLKAYEAAEAQGESQSELHRLPPTQVIDCVEELSDWPMFHLTRDDDDDDDFDDDDDDDDFDDDDDELYGEGGSIFGLTGFADTPAPRPVPDRNPSATANYEYPETIRNEPRTPRNAPCPCGSGKKYKQCCMRNDQ